MRHWLGMTRRWSRPRLRTLFIVATVAAGVGVGVVLLVRHFAGFEERLKGAVSEPSCSRVTTSGQGFAGDEYRGLRRHASHRFAAFCEEVGPDIAWYRFRSQAALSAAIRQSHPTADTAMCVSASRREVLLAGLVPTFFQLCRERRARIVRRGDQRSP